jgi:hypothetical protein
MICYEIYNDTDYIGYIWSIKGVKLTGQVLIKKTKIKINSS